MSGSGAGPRGGADVKTETERQKGWMGPFQIRLGPDDFDLGFDAVLHAIKLEMGPGREASPELLAAELRLEIAGRTMRRLPVAELLKGWVDVQGRKDDPEDFMIVTKFDTIMYKFEPLLPNTTLYGVGLEVCGLQKFGVNPAVEHWKKRSQKDAP